MQGGGFCEKIWIVIIALLSIVFLNVCEDPNLISTKWDGHTHRYATGDNLDETIPGIVCGNTGVHLHYMANGYNKAISNGYYIGPDEKAMFADSYDVEFLLKLNYQDPVCTCPIEGYYQVDNSPKKYEFNISEAFASYDGKQVSLTRDQVEILKKAVDEAYAPWVNPEK